MRDQTEAFQETDWNVLLLLDACREDYFRELCDSSCEPVRSPAPCTRRWIKQMLRRNLLDGATYVNANPVVQDVVTNRNGVPLNVHYFRRASDGTVPPGTLSDAVLDRIDSEGQPDPLVVHYLQPHAPYVGSWEKLKQDRPAEVVRRMRTRKEYAANLWSVWVEACRLAQGLAGRVVITADHGEMLGRDGRWGHECHWDNPELFRVPWLELDGGSQRVLKSELSWEKREKASDSELEKRLQSLGYKA